MTLEDYKNEGYNFGWIEGKEGSGQAWAESPAPDIMSIISSPYTAPDKEKITLEILAKLKEAYTNKNHK